MSVTRVETISPYPAARYRETFSPETPELSEDDILPQGWEGIYFPFIAAFDALRPDGSPTADGVMPDFGLPRRMYAGEDTQFLRPLRIGDEVEQITRPGAVTEKKGRNGRLVFADLIREYRVAGELAIVSTWHDVFLGNPTAVAAVPARHEPFDPGAGWWREQRTLDARHLFRFSALTYNTHLVHYDRDWVRQVEKLDDLLVHGPLTRMLLLDSAIRELELHDGTGASSFSFRSHAPLYVDRPFTIAGRKHDTTSEIVAVGPNGLLAACGTVTW